MPWNGVVVWGERLSDWIVSLTWISATVSIRSNFSWRAGWLLISSTILGIGTPEMENGFLFWFDDSRRCIHNIRWFICYTFDIYVTILMAIVGMWSRSCFVFFIILLDDVCRLRVHIESATNKDMFLAYWPAKHNSTIFSHRRSMHKILSALNRRNRGCMMQPESAENDLLAVVQPWMLEIEIFKIITESPHSRPR